MISEGIPPNHRGHGGNISRLGRRDSAQRYGNRNIIQIAAACELLAPRTWWATALQVNRRPISGSGNMIVHQERKGMHLARKGLTLLELVVVIGILAALAGLVISKIDWSRRQADMATSADTCAELARNIQMYVAEQATLPDAWDSLIETDGSTPYYGSASKTGTTPGIINSSPNMCTMTAPVQLSGNMVSSMTRNGLSTVFMHSPTSTPASNSATTPLAISSSGTYTFCCVIPGSGTTLWNEIYPAGSPNSPAEGSVSLVAFGIGPNSTMIGKTLVGAPTYSGSYNDNPDLDYRRFFAIIAAYADGSRAQLKAVVDSFGRTNNDALEQYIQAHPQ
jgi:prepilin-type N-terminal cleavage/methylation domain-containing protein